jgi:hypothetical protein
LHPIFLRIDRHCNAPERHGSLQLSALRPEDEAAEFQFARDIPALIAAYEESSFENPREELQNQRCFFSASHESMHARFVSPRQVAAEHYKQGNFDGAPT